MAQWTADKWSQYGFNSRLDEYCESIPFHRTQYTATTYFKSQADKS
jgi:hypothetical protein